VKDIFILCFFFIIDLEYNTNSLSIPFNFYFAIFYHLLIMNSTDTEAEMAIVKQAAMDAGATAAVCTDHWARGGKQKRRI